MHFRTFLQGPYYFLPKYTRLVWRSYTDLIGSFNL